MKSRFTSALVLLFVSIFSMENAQAQGCVAIRNMGCSGTTIGGNTSGFLQKGEFQLLSNYRYFKSYKHFRGSHEETARVENNTEVINKANSLELGLSYGITDRLSVAATLPINFNDRSSLYEHYGNPKFDADGNPANPLGWSHSRFNTGSKGIGDLRLTGTYWLMDPNKG
jgi:hypothetical protein